MSVSTARSTVQVECQGCGRSRWVSPERATRIRRGVATPYCRSCKNRGSSLIMRTAEMMQARRDFDDSDLRWWLRSHGAPIQRGEDPSAYVRAHGLPDTLAAIVASLPSPRQD